MVAIDKFVVSQELTVNGARADVIDPVPDREFADVASAEAHLVTLCRSLRPRKDQTVAYYPDSVHFSERVSRPVFGEMIIVRRWQILHLQGDVSVKYAGNIDWRLPSNLPLSWRPA
ncbi:MAG: hypothetical protein WA988_04455 [Candidatus Nanopelagicales bacterium]